MQVYLVTCWYIADNILGKGNHKKIRTIYYSSKRFLMLFYWTLDVSLTASYEITLAHPSFRLSVFHCFLKIGSLFFSDIVHDDSWPWYLATDETKFLEKSFCGPNLPPKCPKSVPKLVFFLPFSWVWIIGFLLNCIQS